MQVSKKGPRDFVTKTDKRVEEILIEDLSKAKKNIPKNVSQISASEVFGSAEAATVLLQ